MALPESKTRLLGFDLVELPTDVFNTVDGPEYLPFIGITEVNARKGKSLTSSEGGVWSGRSHVLASADELYVFLELEANPYVISIREQYPLFSHQVLMDLREGKDVALNRVPTIDFVLTLPPLNFMGPLRYLGLNVKPDNIAVEPGVQRRFAKEERELSQVGWTWSRVKPPSVERRRSLRNLKDWATAGPIDRVARDAAHLAAALYKTTSSKELGALLRMLGRRLGISEKDQYFVFGAAFYLGFVALEKGCQVERHLPLRLAPPPRSVSRALLYV